MSSTPPKITSFLQAKLTRRLAFGVLIYIVLIEASLLMTAVQQYENNQLAQIKQSTIAANVLAVQAISPNLESPNLDDLELLQALSTRLPKSVLGGSLYDFHSGELIGNFGEIPQLTWRQAQQIDSTRQGDRFDIAWSMPGDRPHLLILRQDISQVQPQLKAFLLDSAGRIAILTLAITGGTILLLGITFITPLLELRHGLHQLSQALRRSEETPLLVPQPKLAQHRDELGEVVKAVQQLVHQMAHQMATAVQARQSAEQQLQTVSDQLALEIKERIRIDESNQSLIQTLGDLEVAQAELVESERQNALGQLVAGIAHELNTPLGAMQASAENLVNDLQILPEVLPNLWLDLVPAERQRFVELLEQTAIRQEQLPPRDRRQQRKHLENKLILEGVRETREVADLCLDLGIQNRYAAYLPLLTQTEGNWCRLLLQQIFQLYENSRTIDTAVGRASKIVFALKSYAQGHLQETPTAIDITHSIYSALSLYPDQRRPGIKLTRNYDNLPIIWGYPNALIQVWANLFHNALQAIEGQGEIIISAWVEAEFVIVRVEDSGPGIPAEIQGRIFEPFFTTRSPGEGSGLGLGLCRQVVEQHGGELAMTSQPGQTVFTVRLPLRAPE